MSEETTNNPGEQQPSATGPADVTPPTPETPVAPAGETQPAAAAATPVPATPAATPAPPVTAAVPPAPAAAPATGSQPAKTYFWGTGRRKTSVARVRIRPGSGKFLIRGREIKDYLHELRGRNDVVAPLKATETLGKFDIFVNVHGGGQTGQAQAILLGVARALLKADSSYEHTLRDGRFLTRDSREVERKKPGQPGARKRFQFSKR
ncbi:MAG: 30S ribosomal protein S9 [Phycisphaerae bacterium]